MMGWLMNKLERVWKEEREAIYVVLSQNLPGVTEQTPKSVVRIGDHRTRFKPGTSRIRSKSANHIVFIV
jgi:hypothetical protein